MSHDPKFRFFPAVHDLARSSDVVAYVVVGVLRDGDDLVLGTGSGSRIEAGSDLEERMHEAMGQAFAKGLRILESGGENGPPTLLN